MGLFPFDEFSFVRPSDLTTRMLAAHEDGPTTEPMDVDDTLPPDRPSKTPPWAVLGVDSSMTRPDVEEFVRRFLPSLCTKADVAWISVIRKDRPVEQGDPHTMASEWQWLCHHGAASAAELDRLARAYNVLSGKWMVFCDTAQVDAVWQSIALATAAGWLGPSAKVSPREHAGGDGTHVVCVYVANYHDRDAVRKVRQGLRQLGHVTRLLFKPDAFTYCGIYKNNPWGIATYAFAE